MGHRALSLGPQPRRPGERKEVERNTKMPMETPPPQIRTHVFVPVAPRQAPGPGWGLHGPQADPPAGGGCWNRFPGAPSRQAADPRQTPICLLPRRVWDLRMCEGISCQL